MSDSIRLRDLHRDDVLGAALRSADADGPAHDAEAKLLASLGITAALAAAAAAPAAIGTATAGAVGAGSAGAASSGIGAKLGGSAALKWIAGATLVVSGSVAGHFIVSPSARMPSRALPPHVISASNMASSVSPARSGDAPVHEWMTPAEPSAPAESPSAIPSTASPPPANIRQLKSKQERHVAPIEASPTTSTFEATPIQAPAATVNAPEAPSKTPASIPSAAPPLAPELRALERVHALLASGRPDTALSEIDDYQKAFPNGVMQQESEALRIDALARAGRHEESAARAHAFLAAYPESPHAARIRALLAR